MGAPLRQVVPVLDPLPRSCHRRAWFCISGPQRTCHLLYTWESLSSSGDVPSASSTLSALSPSRPQVPRQGVYSLLACRRGPKPSSPFASGAPNSSAHTGTSLLLWSPWSCTWGLVLSVPVGPRFRAPP